MAARGVNLLFYTRKRHIHREELTTLKETYLSKTMVLPMIPCVFTVLPTFVSVSYKSNDVSFVKTKLMFSTGQIGIESSDARMTF